MAEAVAVAAVVADANSFFLPSIRPDMDCNGHIRAFFVPIARNIKTAPPTAHRLVCVRDKWKAIQPVIAKAARDAADQTLASLAAELGKSPFHAHRALSAMLGETPKQYTQRLRLDRAAGQLLTTSDAILDIALACGFDSPEVFLRAFRRRYGVTPSAYRRRGIVGGGDARVHAGFSAQIAPCVGLFHLDTRFKKEQKMSRYEIVVKDLPAQPVVLVRRRVPREEIGPTIGRVLPSVFQFTQAAGIGIDGHPVTRYPEYGPGMVTLETGMRVTKFTGDWTHGDGGSDGSPYREEFPAGPAASTVHTGPYEGLQQAYGAVEQWIAANGHKPAGAPWEVYLNDPGDHPDPKDWKTEIFWPIEER